MGRGFARLGSSFGELNKIELAEPGPHEARDSNEQYSYNIHTFHNAPPFRLGVLHVIRIVYR